MTRARPFDRSDDTGAALILVLLIVVVVAVVVGALLSLSDTSLRTTLALRGQAADVYSADGAMQAAINNIRNSTYNGAAGTNCFTGGSQLTVPYGSGSATVSCTPNPARVTIQCPSLTQCNRPGSAVLTTGRIVGEDGLNIQQPSGSSFRVHGTIFSNSNINVVNGSLSTNTAVYARGSCSGTIQSTPSPSCNYGNTANSLGNDPGYSPQVASPPAYQPLPACTTPNSVVTFQPGYYDDAAGLSNMMGGNSACRHSTWWFTPGVYYFDFHNSGLDSNPVLGGSTNIWTVNDGYLVAGTPVDSSGKVLLPTGTPPPNPPSIPGACDNPINDANAVGVQFIFGNDSQFAVKAAQAEICGTYSPYTPPVAVYGLKSGSASTTANTVTAAAVTPGDFGNATVANLSAMDGNYATWTTNSNTSGQLGQVTLNGYAAAIPAGSKLVSAKIRVGHRYAVQNNSNKNPSESLAVTITPTGGTPTTVSVPSYTGTNNAEQNDTVDITSALNTFVHSNGFSGASMTYKATVGQAGTESLDGIQLDLTYIAPAFRAESGCVTTGPYIGVGNSSICALVTTVNNSGGLFYTQGTTYAPGAVLDITLNNASEQVFRFGIIARSLWVKETGSFNFGGSVIEVPDDAPGFIFSVFLSVYVCSTSPTCAVSGTPALQSRVGFIDADPTNPASGKRQVVVLSWSTQR